METLWREKLLFRYVLENKIWTPANSAGRKQFRRRIIIELNKIYEWLSEVLHRDSVYFFKSYLVITIIYYSTKHNTIFPLANNEQNNNHIGLNKSISLKKILICTAGTTCTFTCVLQWSHSCNHGNSPQAKGRSQGAKCPRERQRDRQCRVSTIESYIFLGRCIKTKITKQKKSHNSFVPSTAQTPHRFHRTPKKERRSDGTAVLRSGKSLLANACSLQFTNSPLQTMPTWFIECSQPSPHDRRRCCIGAS